MLFKLILLVTVLLSALISGFLYAYSCSVNKGLGRLSDVEYIRAMQSINRAVLNPLFFISFFGTLLMLPLSSWMWYRAEGATPDFYMILASSVVYIVGVFGITGTCNVPLNESLDKFDVDAASPQEIETRRRTFEIPWNRFHTIRTVANIASLALLIWAVI